MKERDVILVPHTYSGERAYVLECIMPEDIHALVTGIAVREGVKVDHILTDEFPDLMEWIDLRLRERAKKRIGD